MISVTQFHPGFVCRLPETYELLRSGNLAVHPNVTKITVHGSRGPAAGYGDGSDIDLSWIVETSAAKNSHEIEQLLSDVLDTTLQNGKGAAELALAAIWDKSGCGLPCFDVTDFDENLCDAVADCFGVYKTQKGFAGFVTGPAVQVRLMYPCMTIWDNKHDD